MEEVRRSLKLTQEEKLYYVKLNKCLACNRKKEYGQDDCYYCEECEDIFYKIPTWTKVLKDWKNGEYPKFNMRNRFLYETSVCKENGIYEEVLVEDKELNRMIYDPNTFAEHMDSNFLVTSFLNLSGDTLLIIPMPEPNTEFTTIKEFEEQASENLKREFWIYAAKEIEKYIDKNEEVWVSTHGKGVGYFHLRICKRPKYYVSELKNL